MSRKTKTPPKPKPPTQHRVENSFEGLGDKLWWLVGLAGLLLVLVIVPSWWKYSKIYQDKLNAGRLYLHRGLYPQAKQSFDQASQTFPLRKIAGLGTVFGDSIGKGVEQLADLVSWDTAAKLGAEEAETFAQTDLQQLEIQASVLFQSHPDSPDIPLLLGRVHADHQHFSAAGQDYQASLKLDADNAEAHFGLGYVHWLEGNLAEAKNHYETAHQREPNNAGYGLNLAWVYAEMGKYQEAFDLYAAFNGNYPVADLEEALILLRIGDVQKAAERFNMASQLLENQDIMQKPENQLPWQYKTDQDLISLRSQGEKQGYLHLLLAVNGYLQGNTEQAKEAWQQAQAASPAGEIRELLRFEIGRLQVSRPEWRATLAAFLTEFN